MNTKAMLDSISSGSVKINTITAMGEALMALVFLRFNSCDSIHTLSMSEKRMKSHQSKYKNGLKTM